MTSFDFQNLPKSYPLGKFDDEDGDDFHTAAVSLATYLLRVRVGSPAFFSQYYRLEDGALPFRLLPAPNRRHGVVSAARALCSEQDIDPAALPSNYHGSLAESLKTALARSVRDDPGFVFCNSLNTPCIDDTHEWARQIRRVTWTRVGVLAPKINHYTGAAEWQYVTPQELKSDS